MNAHEIGHFRAEKGEPWYQGHPITVGSAVEPTLVLLNHSCDPNINRINIGRCTVVVAAKDIEKDEEICDCYLPLGIGMPRENRQLELQTKYHFDCNCFACFENWPVNSLLPKGLNDISPDKFRFALDDVKSMQVRGLTVLRSTLGQICSSPKAVHRHLSRFGRCNIPMHWTSRCGICTEHSWVCHRSCNSADALMYIASVSEQLSSTRSLPKAVSQ